MIDLSVYANRRICVAVSGGRDSMALLNFIYTHMREHGIVLSALNCDHKIRGKESKADSDFVKKYCAERNIPLTFFEWNSNEAKTEERARIWRRQCYEAVLNGGAEFVATAHHMNDNAETVLFNLARGSSVSGLSGIYDSGKIIHPLVSCTRAQIDEYVLSNGVPYVDDETNFTENYTRNKIRLNVLPELEKAVSGTVKNIYSLSRLASEDEEYFKEQIEKRKILNFNKFGVTIRACESVIFKRAALQAIKRFKKKDYTQEHLKRLFELSSAEKGKKFEFLGLTAYAEGGKIVLTEENICLPVSIPFETYRAEEIGGVKLVITEQKPDSGKYLKADAFAIGKNAVVRFRRKGDRFKKFKGGEKSLGDYFTDEKIPLYLRDRIPLIADGSCVLAVCGVEISDAVKTDENTQKTIYIISENFSEVT